MGSDETQCDSGSLRLGHLQYHSSLTSGARHCDTNRSSSVTDLSWRGGPCPATACKPQNRTHGGAASSPPAAQKHQLQTKPSWAGSAPSQPRPPKCREGGDGRTSLSVRPAACLRPEVRASHSAPRAAGMITNARGSHAACSAVWAPWCVPRRLSASGAEPAHRRPERWRCSGECGAR